MSNVKPGDRAMITRAPYTPENIGKVVLVIREYKHGEELPGQDGIYATHGSLYWVVESLGGLLAVYDTLTGMEHHPIRAVNDSCLTRLEPPDEVLDQGPVAVPVKDSEAVA